MCTGQNYIVIMYIAIQYNSLHLCSFILTLNRPTFGGQFKFAYYSYGDGSGTDPYFWGEDYLDLMELEAEMEEDAGENSEYWFDAPEFN